MGAGGTGENRKGGLDLVAEDGDGMGMGWIEIVKLYEGVV